METNSSLDAVLRSCRQETDATRPEPSMGGRNQWGDLGLDRRQTEAEVRRFRRNLILQSYDLHNSHQTARASVLITIWVLTTKERVPIYPNAMGNWQWQKLRRSGSMKSDEMLRDPTSW